LFGTSYVRTNLPQPRVAIAAIMHVFITAICDSSRGGFRRGRLNGAIATLLGKRKRGKARE